VYFPIHGHTFHSLYTHTHTLTGSKNIYTHFHRGYLRIFSKLNQNIICGVYCDVVSKDGTSHMNARATLSNGRTVGENGGGTVVRAMQK
jgi:hypothetical protein